MEFGDFAVGIAGDEIRRHFEVEGEKDVVAQPGFGFHAVEEGADRRRAVDEVARHRRLLRRLLDQGLV